LEIWRDEIKNKYSSSSSSKEVERNGKHLKMAKLNRFGNLNEWDVEWM